MSFSVKYSIPNIVDDVRPSEDQCIPGRELMSLNKHGNLDISDGLFCYVPVSVIFM